MVAFWPSHIEAKPSAAQGKLKGERKGKHESNPSIGRRKACREYDMRMIGDEMLSQIRNAIRVLPHFIRI